MFYSVSMNQPIIINRSQDSLAGCLLVATKQIGDDFFSKSVVYIVAHNQNGAMGIVINRPASNVSLEHILSQIQLNVHIGDRSLPLLIGGPIDEHRGFIIHNGNYLQETALSAYDGITVTANAAVLGGWINGDFTSKALLALGYSGWTAGQLESEIEEQSWMTIPATSHLLFDTPNDAKWDLAVASLGFDIGNLSANVGHA